MQSLWCYQQILTKSVAQVHVYLPKGALAFHEPLKVLVHVLPLGVLLFCLLLEVGKEVPLLLFFVKEVITLIDDTLKATATNGFCLLRHVVVVVTLTLVLRLGVDVDAERLMSLHLYFRPVGKSR